MKLVLLVCAQSSILSNKVEAEISPVELIAELIEIELQEVFLDIVIRVKNAALDIADGYVYPRKYSADPGLVLHDISFMSATTPFLTSVE